MQNHIKNIVKMKGVASLPLFTDNNGSQEFDFNKLIPMPESLNMESGSIEDLAIEAVIQKIATRRYSFQRALAVPAMSEEEFAKRTAHLSMDDLCKCGLQYISNKVLYGATSWYDWRCDNWGTKWNAHDTKIPGENLLVFTTAWGPPESVIAKLAERYPHTDIEHWWADEDIGSNSGYIRYSHGQAEETSYCENGSSDAYKTYILCWGESSCLYQDKEGIWHHKDCEQCHGCD
ncbi:MAG: hypothetical protein K2P33_12565 [Acutalibacter sp.]|nr:hypothetical protein [Acutalibacter sp.]